MSTLPPGKTDVSAFLRIVGDYHIGVYGRVEVVRARLLPKLRGTDPEVRGALASWDGQAYVHGDDAGAEVVLVRTAGSKKDRLVLPIVMFLATVLTTMAAGALLQGVDPVRTRFLELGGVWFPVPTGLSLTALWQGAVFALPFLGILLCHEAGHYLAARRHKIPVSLPFFIPFPPWYSLVGTLGAFIRIKGPTVRRPELLDVAVAGPVASFLLSVPILLLGLSLSGPAVGVVNSAAPFLVRFAGETVGLGNGPLLHALGSLIFREGFGSVPVELHPVAFAGWLGLLVTALNLMPLGQLDGGHIIYCLWEQPGQVRAARIFLLVLVPLGTLWWGVVVMGRLGPSRQPGSSTSPAGSPSRGAPGPEAPPLVLVRYPDISPHLCRCSRITLVLCSQSLFRFADLGDDGLCRGGPDKGCGVIVSAIDVVVDRLD